MLNRKLILVTAALFAATLWGCGSEQGSGGGIPTPGPVGDAALVGSDSCKVCHSLAHNRDNQLVGSVPNTLDVIHGEHEEYGCETCHGGGQYHRGLGPIPNPRPTAATCAGCHEQVDAILAWNSHVFQDGSGNAAPACASCHDPLTMDPAARIAAQNCMSCHADTTVVDPANSPISVKVAASMHSGGASRTGANCQRCHTVDGFLNLIDKGINPTANANYTGNEIAARALAPTCAACHDPHTGGMRAVPGWDPNQNGVADQFDTCTACHNLFDNDGNLVTTFYHQNDWYRNIQSTHYDDPATASGAAPYKIEGYVIRTQGDNPCFDCHGHELRTNTRRHLEDPALGSDRGATIHTDWANSRHGGELLKVKVAAAAVVGATIADIKAAATEKSVGHGWSWTYYDWDAANRQACQRCHTSTGAANFLTDPANYVAANNDFSHVAPGQNEMLYCWGCHTSVDTGELRDPGALTISYSNSASVEFPNSAASNTCIACHSGRENGDSIKNDPNTTGVRSFLNSHYLTAGGIVFGTGGYEYDGKDYAFAAGDRHQNLGYGAGTPTGDANFDAVSSNYTSGPCVTCHFDSSDAYGQDRSHTLSPFTDTVADGTVLNEVCVVCHTARGVGDAANIWYGKDFTEADFVDGVQATEHKGRMLGAQLALLEVLASKGIHFYEAHPYFYTASYVVGGTNTAFTDWASVYGVDQWKNVMGAAFNYNLIAHDPGATAHNRRYARRLIYDSIDFLDDGVINDSTNATVTAQGKPFTTSALGYIGSRP